MPYVSAPSGLSAVRPFIRDPRGFLRRAAPPRVARHGVTAAPQLANALPSWSRTPVATTALTAADVTTGVYDGAALGAGLLATPGSVSTQPFWVSVATPQFSPDTVGDFVARSSAVMRDGSVTGWCRNGDLLLRLTDEGKAFRLHHNGEGATGIVSVEIVEGATVGSPDATVTKSLFYTSNAVAEIEGYVREATDSHLFRLSTDGGEVIAEFSAGTDSNGVRQWTTFYDSRTSGWLHMEAGRAAWVAGPAGNYGHRRLDYEVHYLRPTWSDAARVGGGGYQAGVYDARDFGLREGRTTGSVAAGSNQLLLAADLKLAPGDGIAVARGGESEGGVIGSRIGVGGYWPGRSLATYAELPDPLSLPHGEGYYIEDLDEVHIRVHVYEESPGGYTSTVAAYKDLDPELPLGSRVLVTSTGVVYEVVAAWYHQDYFYDARPVPYGLRATVLDVSPDGRTVTLDRPAEAATTNATAVFDNAAIDLWREDALGLFTQGLAPRVVFPEGDFYLGAVVNVSDDGAILEGAGKWHTKFHGVPGLKGVGIRTEQSPGTVVRWMGFFNHFTPTTHAGKEYVAAVYYGTNTSDSLMEDLLVVNASGGVLVSYSDRALMRLLDIRQAWDESYVQWHSNAANSSGCIAEDVTHKAQVYSSGHEFFLGSDNVARRIGGVNVVNSNNTTDAALQEDWAMWMDEGAAVSPTGQVLKRDNPVISNTQIIGGQQGNAGLTRGVRQRNLIVACGGPNPYTLQPVSNTPAGDWMPRGYDITPATWEDAQSEDCLYWIPPRLRGQTAARGLTLDAGVRTVIDAFRTTTADVGIEVVASGATIQNCVADTIQAVPGTTQTGNVDYAAWLTGSPSPPPPAVDFRIERTMGPGRGAVNVFAYSVDENNRLVPLCTSTRGKVIRWEWEFLDAGGNVIGTDRTWFGSYRFPTLAPGQSVRLRAMDEEEQWGTLTKPVVLT